VRVSDRKLDVKYPTWELATRGEPELQALHELIRAAVAKRLHQPKTISLGEVYGLYSKLPEPRMLSIAYDLRGALLRAFGAPRTRDARSMLQYFALVGDIKKAGLPLRRSEWNFAISFASRYVRKTTRAELVTAMKLWREMESDWGIMANEVTFNILFDVASKAHDFALAEEVYKEMDVRGIPFNRYHYVSMIHFFGLKQDGDGVRAAYREMVEDGQIIDTMVLNCVIASLLRSGEEDAAADIYERMKSANNNSKETSAAPPPRPPPHQDEWGSNRLVRRVLMMYGKLSKKHPDMSQHLQATTSLAPDLQTFRILSDHFGVKLGDLPRLSRYLDDMGALELPLHGAIYSVIFRVFSAHGGNPNNHWTEEMLKRVFQTMLDAVDAGVEGLRIEVRLAMQVIHAFTKCSDADTTREALEQMRARLKVTKTQEMFLEDVLFNALERKGTSKIASGLGTKGIHQEEDTKKNRRKRNKKTKAMTVDRL
jgi:pentatricopeptide repeat protein